MRFAIRDDDTSYFTRPEELDRVWGTILPYAPVSLAVVPYSLEPFHLGDVQRFYQGTTPRAVRENAELVIWLHEKLARKQIAVMCHGYTHEYRRTGPETLEQEFIWKPYDRLLGETRHARQHLEETFGTAITTFVPPGNGISRPGIMAVGGSFANLMAAFPLRRITDFRLEARFAWNYARRLYYQARYGIANPFGETVSGVRLLPSFSLTAQVTWDRIRGWFELCRRLGADFIVAVHYWEMDQQLRDILANLLDLAAKSGCEFCSCPELFRVRAATVRERLSMEQSNGNSC